MEAKPIQKMFMYRCKICTLHLQTLLESKPFTITQALTTKLRLYGIPNDQRPQSQLLHHSYSRTVTPQ